MKPIWGINVEPPRKGHEEIADEDMASPHYDVHHEIPDDENEQFIYEDTPRDWINPFTPRTLTPNLGQSGGSGQQIGYNVMNFCPVTKQSCVYKNGSIACSNCGKILRSQTPLAYDSRESASFVGVGIQNETELFTVMRNQLLCPSTNNTSPCFYRPGSNCCSNCNRVKPKQQISYYLESPLQGSMQDLEQLFSEKLQLSNEDELDITRIGFYKDNTEIDYGKEHFVDNEFFGETALYDHQHQTSMASIAKKCTQWLRPHEFGADAPKFFGNTLDLDVQQGYKFKFQLADFDQGNWRLLVCWSTFNFSI
jgi:hypothetical protein